MRRFRGMLVSFSALAVAGWFCRWGGIDRFVDGDPIVTQKVEDVVGTEIRNAEDPLRDGTQKLWEGVGDTSDDKIYYEEIEDTQSAREKTTDYIKGLMNYALALAGLVALVYLIYHGFMAVTAGGDEDRLKKWMQGVRYALIAIIGIGIARFLISLIFRLINLLTGQ